MDGSFVKELADQMHKPGELAGMLIVPAGFNVYDPEAIIKPGPTAAPLAVSSLGSLRDYLIANRDGLDVASLVVHVQSPVQVTVSGPLLPRARNRESFLVATAVDLTTGLLGTPLTVEQFIVGLQTRCIKAGDLSALLAVFSNVKHEAVKTSQDDGVTQVVQTKAGIALVGEQAIRNPVGLMPFRTFREVAQPLSAFAVRVANTSNGAVQVTLAEADGGNWRLEAVSDIKAWLLANLPAGVAVLG